MADEQEFIEQGLQRTQIDLFFAEELGRAGYGGMEMAPTPMGTQIVLKAEKPGMVIGKGGENIRKVTATLEREFDLEDPQIDVQEVDEPDLNARIVADRLANALERGWYFRKAGHTTLERIMDAGALGAEIVLAGKVTGARSRVEKFNEGYIKHNGEPAETIVDAGQSVAVMKLGTIGVNVKIIPPGAELPDDFRVHEDVDPEEVVIETPEGDETLEDLLAEPEPAEEEEPVPEGMPADPDPSVDPDAAGVGGSPGGEVDLPEEEPVDDAVPTAPDDEVEFDDVETPGEEAAIAEELDELESDVDSAAPDARAEADRMMAEMDDDDEEDDDA